MPDKKSIKTIYDHAFSKGKEFGYMEALSDMIDKEETVLMSTDDETAKQPYQTETLVIQSKYLRALMKDLIRDKAEDN